MVQSGHVQQKGRLLHLEMDLLLLLLCSSIHFGIVSGIDIFIPALFYFKSTDSLESDFRHFNEGLPGPFCSCFHLLRSFVHIQSQFG